MVDQSARYRHRLIGNTGSDILLLCTRSNTVARGEEKTGSTSQSGSDLKPGKPAAVSTAVVSGKVNDSEGCIQAEKGEVRRVEIAR
jgi:hypothetical protein